MTKPQKIEGGWRDDLQKLLSKFAQGVSETGWRPNGEDIEEFLSTEIEKAKASERQRCVEALPKKIPVSFMDKPYYSNEWKESGFNQAIDQAKRKLEQLK